MSGGRKVPSLGRGTPVVSVTLAAFLLCPNGALSLELTAEVLRASPSAIPRPGDSGFAVAIRSICGNKDDSQDVEFYDPKAAPQPAPGLALVAAVSPSTAQLRWEEGLAAGFRGAGDNPGNVAGVKWCTGTLVGKDIFLTAAHCVRVLSNGDYTTPIKAGVPVPPRELVKLMSVAFNYQVEKKSREESVPDTYPVEALLEYGDESPAVDGEHLDFAVLRLGKNADGKFPGDTYSPRPLSRRSLTTDTPILVVQHPSQKPKRVASGKILRVGGARVTYNDVDTEAGASGSGILAWDGALVGVHTNGGCTEFASMGSNSGISLQAIAKVSKALPRPGP